MVKLIGWAHVGRMIVYMKYKTIVYTISLFKKRTMLMINPHTFANWSTLNYITSALLHSDYVNYNVYFIILSFCVYCSVLCKRVGSLCFTNLRVHIFGPCAIWSNHHTIYIHLYNIYTQYRIPDVCWLYGYLHNKHTIQYITTPLREIASHALCSITTWRHVIYSLCWRVYVAPHARWDSGKPQLNI